MQERQGDLAVSWLIIRHFKAQHGILDCYMIPIAGMTSSGIQFFTWTQRFLRKMAQEVFNDGWAFQRPDGSRVKASDYQDKVFHKLDIIQSTTTLIGFGCSKWDE